MPNEEHLKILRKGVRIWNDWRRTNPQVKPDLSCANLNGIPLSIPKNLRISDFEDASILDLGDLYIGESSRTINSGIDLRWANLNDTNLEEADLRGQYLRGTRFERSSLKNARLEYATLIDTNCDRANLSGCRIYGISVWHLKGIPLDQSNLLITRKGESRITVDSIEVAQFIYLLINHKKMRDVLNCVTKKGVLLLGPFKDGGLEILQAIAGKLRETGYIPIIFDFDKPECRNLTETVITLVGLSRFVVVDLSGGSVPHELSKTIPHFKIPFVPIIKEGKEPYSMFNDFQEDDYVLKPVVQYASLGELIEIIPSKVIEPAEEKCKERQKLLDQAFIQR